MNKPDSSIIANTNTDAPVAEQQAVSVEEKGNTLRYSGIDSSSAFFTALAHANLRILDGNRRAWSLIRMGCDLATCISNCGYSSISLNKSVLTLVKQ